MQHGQLTERIRTFVEDWFARTARGDDGTVSEAMLINDGHFCGRRFEFADQYAVWFFEERELKFYQADGTVAEVVDLDDTKRLEHLGRAA